MKDNHCNSEQSPSKPQWQGFDFFEEKLSATEVEKNVSNKAFSDITKSFPLAMASVGESMHIVKFQASEDMVRRLMSMGFAPGCQVQVISNTGGSVIVAIGANRIGLGVGMAQKIMCTNCTDKANG